MSTKPLNELLDEIEQYCEAATPGPWEEEATESVHHTMTLKYRGIRLFPEFQVPTGYGGIHADTNFPDGTPQGDQASRNMAFIARARTDLPRLVKEARELRDELDVANDALENQWKLIAELRALRDKWLALLNPANPDETVEGAIRNLQQAYITERDNAIEGPARIKEELIKKVKEKAARAHAGIGIVSSAGNALDELADELEKVEIK